MVCFLSAMALESKIKITHIFPARGHSYCQCDRNFGLYSRQVKQTETIETADEYVDIIKNCKKESKFIVKECEIKDFGQHLNGMFTKPKDLQLSTAVVIKYKHSGRVEVHQNYAQMIPTSFTILKKNHSARTLHSASVAERSTVKPAKSLLPFVSHLK